MWLRITVEADDSPTAMPLIARRLFLERAWIRAAVDQDALAGDEPGVRRAEKRAQRAEFIRHAQPLRGNRVDPLRGRRVIRDALLLGAAFQCRAQSIRVERAGK